MLHGALTGCKDVSLQLCGMCRFIVPKHLQSLFSATWQERESAMKHYPGFQGLSVVSDGDHVTVSSR